MILAVLLAGCAPEPALLVLEPDDGRTGEDGEDGPLGVAVAPARAQGRVTDVVTYSVTFPALPSGTPDLSGAPFPTMVWVHGGFVAPDRYRWLATHLASRGAVVVMPEHPFDLAILETDNGRIALDDLLESNDPRFAGLVGPDAPVGLGGHSLGGVVATRQWLADARFDVLVLAASYPAEGDDLSSRAGTPVLAITGARDGAALPEDVAAGLERFAEPSTLAVVDGMTHYDWTDDATERELAREEPPGRPTEDSRRDALRVLDTWLDAWWLADPAAWDRLDAPFPGVTVTP